MGDEAEELGDYIYPTPPNNPFHCPSLSFGQCLTLDMTLSVFWFPTSKVGRTKYLCFQLLDNDTEKISALILSKSPELPEGANSVCASSEEKGETEEAHFLFFTVLLAS